MKILVVDDSKYLRTKVISYLKSRNGDDILEAGNEKEAYDAIEKNKINLVLLDIIMENDNSGLNILKRIRETSSQTKVIIVSVVEDDKVIGEAMRLGANGYVSKPVEEKRLFKEIEKVFAIKKEKGGRK